MKSKANHSTPVSPMIQSLRLGVLASVLLVSGARGEVPTLATEPFALKSAIQALPNIMFVLDDSGSMDSDYLPDWAGPYKDVDNNVVTLPNRFFNGSFNGLAYNPAVRYRAPVMYTATGDLDVTTYPSMIGQGTATGGDATATAGAPNWRAVKKDGYGIQSAATVNLEGAAFFYTVIPGEYCTANNLRSCTASATPSGSYTFAAPLRWCNTDAQAFDTTAGAGTNCQASRIDPAAGITAYTFARIPRPRTATVTVNGIANVTGITVGGVQILSATATGASTATLATDIAAKINACTLGIAGSCGTLGYSATVSSNVVTVTAPIATTVSPTVTGGTTSVTAFSNGNVPGENLFSVITPSVNSYPYPGSATKASGRSDCAGTTCTYIEEMTNYANWYAYYRTRMQAMKTSASLAFSSIDEKFRVGYFSINNGAGSDFIGVSAFNGVQRNAWYTKFFAAKPYGPTPLRTGLATAGQYYAGKLSTINTVSAADPMEYSCQQNFTILSTDGYWNDAVTPKQIDGTTEIGQQDGNENRPYYDGATQTRTSTQTLREDIQTGKSVKLVEKMTQQIQRTTTPVDKAVATTIVYDWEREVSQLQQRTKTLEQTQHNLRKVTRQLIKTPLIYTELTIRYNRVTEPLNSHLNKLRETTQLAQQRTQGVRKVTTKLKKTTHRITVTETPLQRNTYLLTKTTRKLQKRSSVSYNGGDSYSWTAWSDVTGAGNTCTAGVVSPPSNSGGVLTNNVECQYVVDTTEPNQDSCTRVAESVAPNYTVQRPVQCTYQNASTETVTGTYTNYTNKVTSGDNYVKAIIYTYGTAASPQTGQLTCDPKIPDTGTANGSSYTGPARTCAWDASEWAADTGIVSSGTCVVNNPADVSSARVLCTYVADVTSDNQDECTVKTGNSGSASGNTYSILDTVVCSRSGQNFTSWANVLAADSCTYAMTGAHANNPGSGNNTLWKRRVECRHSTTQTNVDNLASCTVKTGLSGAAATLNTVYTAMKTCSYAGGTVSSGSDLGTCTQGTASSGSANNAVWDEYTSCTWGAASTSGPFDNCALSGGQSGNNFTGPRVTCQNRAATSAPNPACVPSSPNPPVPLYSSPIVTCEYVADTAHAVPVTECTPSATVACAYDTASTLNNQATCKPQSETPVAGTYYGPSVACSWITGTTTPVNNCTVTSQAVDGTGNYNGPAYTCAYNASWSAWSNVAVGGSCVWRNQSAGPTNYEGPEKQCQYGPSTDTRVGTCTPVTGSSGTNTGDTWSVVQQVACVPGPHNEGPNTVNTPNAGSCVQGTSVTNPTPGVVQTVVTSCTWGTPNTVNTGICNCSAGGSVTASPPSCNASGGESPAGTFNTLQVCSITNQDPTPANGIDDRVWEAVAPTCASTVGAFDGNGTLVECRTTDVTTGYTAEYPAPFPVPVDPATCTAGTDPVTKYQTICPTTMPKTKPPEPVQTCVAASPSAPDYVRTTCTPNNTSATVMGCSPETASAPLWQTVTCAWNGGQELWNTLADVAMYYYKTDIRSPVHGADSCVGANGAVLCTDTDPMNNVPTTATDTNSAQHMTTFTLGLGASGYLRYSATYNTDGSGDFHTVKGNSPYLAANGITANPASGICSWQSSGHCNWPVPVSAQQTTIDDLWHAGVNGRGAYFSATDPVSLANSISSTLAQVASQSAVAAAATVSNPVLTPGDSYVFSGTYKTVDWTGDVMRFTLDPFTGLPAPTVDWSAQAKLDAKGFATRNIYTFDGSVATTKLKAFTTANFATNAYFNTPHISGLTQFTCLYPDICLSATNQNSSNASGANLVNYLRGERANEGAETDNNKFYRERQHVLGDIVNAQVLYVTSPSYSYVDPGYEAFKTAKASRQAMAYAAANDGMLHAIAAKGSAATEDLVIAAANAYAAAVLDPGSAAKATAAATADAAAKAALASDTVIGQEMWAFIPTKVMPHLYRLADKKYRDKHRPFVDASPVVGDVCTSLCTDAANAVWKTILVGGLGRGGRGYYALDITDPASPKALWEFTNDNLGYSYGTPQIAKMSDGTWVVMFTSGYNNIPNDDGATGDGVGRLFVLNAGTGAQITGVSPLSTGVGSVASPSGLAKISASVISPSTDATVVAVYGGDLLGNLWRFDINDSVGATGVEAQLLAALKDGDGKAQPITTRPVISLVQKKYIVLVGTGRFLDSTDAPKDDPQSLYGIIDNRSPATTPGTAIYDNPGGTPRLTDAGVNGNGFVMQKLTEVDCPTGAPSYICTSGQKVMTSSNVKVDYNVHNGWFVDLINDSERSNLDPALALGTFVVNTNAPTSNACDLGGKSYQYWLDYKTGAAIQAPGMPPIAGLKISDSLVNAPTLFTTDDGLRVGTQRPCVGPGCFDVRPPPRSAESSITRRTSWRELITTE